MLFCKLLLSPMPHARVRSIDASEALAMPGVKAILTADDCRRRPTRITDNGTADQGEPVDERGLTMEPLYQGEPILAVAPSTSSRPPSDRENPHRLRAPPFVVDPLETLRPGGPNARADGNVWCPASSPGSRHRSAARTSRSSNGPRRTSRRAKDGSCRWARHRSNGRTATLEAGFKNAALVLDETFVTPDTSHQTLETRSAMAYWQNGKVYVHTGTQSTAQTRPASRAG